MQSGAIVRDRDDSKSADSEGALDRVDKCMVVKIFCHTTIQHELLETSIQGPSELYPEYVHIWSISGTDTVEGRKLIGREFLSEFRRILGGAPW